MGADQGGHPELPQKIHPAFREHLLSKLKEKERLDKVEKQKRDQIDKQAEELRQEAAAKERLTKIENQEMLTEEREELEQTQFDDKLVNVHPLLRQQIEKERKHGSHQAWLLAEAKRKEEARLKAE